MLFPREPILQHPRTKLLCFELKQSRPHLADTQGETLNVTGRRLVTRHGVQIKLSSKNVASKKRSQISFHGDFVSTRIISLAATKGHREGKRVAVSRSSRSKHGPLVHELNAVAAFGLRNASFKTTRGSSGYRCFNGQSA